MSVNVGVASRQLPQLWDLASFDVAALKLLWHSLFKSSPPRVGRKEFFIRVLAYEVQRRSNGDLSKSCIKALRTLGADKSLLEAPRADIPPLCAGARLVREWRGETHEVMVMERGYAYRGRSYTSLSEIARDITGARWSGPRFFGLRSRFQKEGAAKTA